MGIGAISQSNSAAAHLRAIDGNGRVGASRRVETGRIETVGPGVVSDINAQNIDTRVAISGVNRTISMLESADGAAEAVQEGLRRMRELASAAGNESLPEQIRAGLSGKFDDIMADIRAVSKETSFEGNPLANGAPRRGVAGGEEVALPPTDLRPEKLGIDRMDGFQLWSPQSRYDVIDRIDAATAEAAAQRA